MQSFYFVRHGQTDWNLQRRPQGQTDIPLNETGIAQAQRAADLLQDVPCSLIVTSPLQRALTTATIIGNALQKPIHIIDELKECSWGIMEGRQPYDPAWAIAWRQGAVVQGAESYQNFKERVQAGLQKVFSYKGPVIIVSHGAVYGALQELLNLETKHEIANCCPVYHALDMQVPGFWRVQEMSAEIQR
jgi:broad specificity phosphatase PhoE